MPKLRNQDWRKESAHLLDVRTNVLWSPDSKSFSAWLKKQAVIKGIQISTLWRYLGAAAFAVKLQTGDWATVTTPERIPHTIHAESIELLEKIGRVTPIATFDQLAADLYHARIVRKDLLKIWQIYRVALPKNATARGYNVAKPLLSENNEQKRNIVFEQLALGFLEKTDPKFLGYPAFVKTIGVVALDSSKQCTAILIGRGVDNTILTTDLVAVKLFLFRPHLNPLRDNYSEQRLWLIAPAEEEIAGRDLPEKWGRISIGDGVLVINKPLSGTPEQLSAATQLLLSKIL